MLSSSYQTLKTPSERIQYIFEVIMKVSQKSQKQIADLLDITSATLTHLKNSTRKINTNSKTLIKMERVFGVNRNYIIEGKGLPFLKVDQSKLFWKEIFKGIQEFSQNGIKLLQNHSTSAVVANLTGWTHLISYYYDNQNCHDLFLEEVERASKSEKQSNKMYGSLITYQNKYELLQHQLEEAESQINHVEKIHPQESSNIQLVLFQFCSNIPKGFLIAKKNSLPPSKYIETDQLLFEPIAILDAKWLPIKTDSSIQYFILLTHEEYYQICYKNKKSEKTEQGKSETVLLLQEKLNSKNQIIQTLEELNQEKSKRLSLLEEKVEYLEEKLLC